MLPPPFIVTALFHVSLANTLNVVNASDGVQFPPQGSTENKTFNFIENSNAQICITIESNFKPTSLIWFVRNSNASSENYTQTSNENTKAIDIDLPTSEDRKRYTLSNLTSTEKSTKYLANLTIKNVTKFDQLKSYHLMVTSEMGSQNYYFNINVTSSNSPVTKIVALTTIVQITTDPKPREGSPNSNGALTALAVIIVIAILIIGSVIYYKVANRNST